MIKSYFTIAWRNLLRHKLFSLINVFGLAIGMTVCIMAILDVRSAYNYDKFHADADRIFRINTIVVDKDNRTVPFASTPFPLRQQLNNSYNFIQNTVQVFPVNFTLFTKNGSDLPADVYFTDGEFLKVFGFKMSAGSLRNDPQTVVVTAATATRFFGQVNPIGKTLHHKKWGNFTVTGILKPSRLQSHLQFDMLASLSTIPLIQHSSNGDFKTDDWIDPSSSYTYVKLKDASQTGILNLVLNNFGTKASALVKPESWAKSISFSSQNLNDITPSSTDYVNGGAGPTLGKILTEVAVGLVTLLLAVFNYINLTLARSLTRSREVGIRKVIGAQRWQLIMQFVAESIVIAFGALCLSFVLLQLVMSLHARVVQQILNDARWDAPLIVTLIIFAVVTGLCAGIIPARILSSFKPASVLKSQTGQPIFQRLTLRKALMVLQFTVSFVGIVFMMVMSQQSMFSATANLNFNRKDIINIDIDPKDRVIIKNEVVKIAGVERVSAASVLLGLYVPGRIKIYNDDKSKSVLAATISGDENFVKNMGLSLSAGKNVDRAQPGSVLINEKSLPFLKFKDARSAVNQIIWLNDSTRVRVSGVLKDFHYTSVNFPVGPMILTSAINDLHIIQVKVSGNIDKAVVMASVARTLKKLRPRQNFNVRWYETEYYEHHLHSEDQVFLGIIIGMSLSIACMGLLGMVTYTTEVRVKEIGIRKVMGAGVLRIVYLLSSDFIKLLLVAAFIAIPAGMIVGNKFLQHFAYHIHLGWGTGIVALVILMFIGLATIAWQAFKTATANPINSLRNE